MGGEDACGVCREAPETPHTAPCGHVFCLLCVLRALRAEPACPVCRRTPLLLADLSTRCHPRLGAPPLPALPLRETPQACAQLLRRYGLPTDAPFSALRSRCRELINQLAVDRFRTAATPRLAPVRAVLGAEQAGGARQRAQIARHCPRILMALHCLLLKIRAQLGTCTDK